MGGGRRRLNHTFRRENALPQGMSVLKGLSGQKGRAEKGHVSCDQACFRMIDLKGIPFPLPVLVLE